MCMDKAWLNFTISLYIAMKERCPGFNRINIENACQLCFEPCGRGVKNHGFNRVKKTKIIHTHTHTLYTYKTRCFGMLALMCCICKENSGQVSVTVREKEKRERNEMDVCTSQIKSRPGVYNCDAK